MTRIDKTVRMGWLSVSAIMFFGMVLCFMIPDALIGFFTNDPDVIHYGVIYLTILSLGNVFVGTIMTVSAIFQGLGKTYPTLVAAIVDNGLFALLVFTLPILFGWGIHAVWWIKLSTAVIEMMLGVAWLKIDLARRRTMLSERGIVVS